jgi:phosphomannomutase
LDEVLEQIFKSYDVRGLYPEQLNEDFAFKLGQAVVQFFKAKTVAVGRDCRNGGDKLFDGLSRGITAQGGDVIDLGLVSTDMLYFAVGQFGFDAGCMITASHNPKEWNGFKFCGKGAMGISKNTGFWDIRDMVSVGKFPESAEKGKIVQRDVLNDYIDKCFSLVHHDKIKPLKIVVDAGNGMAGKTIPEVEKKLPLEIIRMFFELDGNFPNHEPNPLKPETIAALRDRVLEEKADLGVIFDGDGDRMFMVDEKGQTVTGSLLTCIIAENFLKKQPGSKILHTIVMSKAVPEVIKENGGIPVLERVGHGFIKPRMRDENILFGGELSGHFFFRENFFADSGLVALLVTLEVISDSGKKLSEIVAPFKRYVAINETNSDVKDKEAKISELKSIYASNAKKTDDSDGFTAYFDDWWFNVRPSGTENLLRLNLEADSKELAEEKKEELLKAIRN